MVYRRFAQVKSHFTAITGVGLTWLLNALACLTPLLYFFFAIQNDRSDYFYLHDFIELVFVVLALFFIAIGWRKLQRIPIYSSRGELSAVIRIASGLAMLLLIMPWYGWFSSISMLVTAVEIMAVILFVLAAIWLVNMFFKSCISASGYNAN